MKAGRIILGGLLGLLFLLFVALDLVLFGVIPLNSVVVTILPLIGLVLGVVLAVLAAKRQAPPPEATSSTTFAPPTPV